MSEPKANIGNLEGEVPLYDGRIHPIRGRRYRVRLTVTPETTGTPVDLVAFTFAANRKGETAIQAGYSNLKRLANDGMDALGLSIMLGIVMTWCRSGLEILSANHDEGRGRR